MIYMTPTELASYKTWFDLSGYTDLELEMYIEMAQSLIDDYIWYGIDYEPVVDELMNWVVQRDRQLFVSLKSRDIDTITGLKVNSYWWTYIDMPLTYLNLFSKAWYFYLDFSPEFYYTYFRVMVPWRIDCKVSYTKIDKWIPAVIKFAITKIIWNILRADYNLQNWVAWTDWTIQSFTSWDYSVKLSGSTLAYTWVWGSWWSINNIYMDDWVQALLYKLRRTGQNIY